MRANSWSFSLERKRTSNTLRNTHMCIKKKLNKKYSRFPPKWCRVHPEKLLASWIQELHIQLLLLLQELHTQMLFPFSEYPLFLWVISLILLIHNFAFKQLSFPITNGHHQLLEIYFYDFTPFELSLLLPYDASPTLGTIITADGKLDGCDYVNWFRISLIW